MKSIEELKKITIKKLIDNNKTLSEEQKIIFKNLMTDIQNYDELCEFVIENSNFGEKSKEYIKNISKMKIPEENKVFLLQDYIKHNDLRK